MAGRIEIDDVAPVVSAGRYPAKAVVGEVVPISATVWREGHDAVAASLVVRYHGPLYPQLADTPPGATPVPAPPRAKVKRWPIMEQNHLLFVWNDPEGNAPIAEDSDAASWSMVGAA